MFDYELNIADILSIRKFIDAAQATGQITPDLAVELEVLVLGQKKYAETRNQKDGQIKFKRRELLSKSVNAGIFAAFFSGLFYLAYDY